MTIHGPTSHNFVSQRLRLHYVDWGNAEKPPLLLIHGGRDHCRSWDWVAQELRADWHIIAMDHRGHGDSEWCSDGNYDNMDMVYDIAQLVRQLDLGPVTIISHSMGAQVCTRFAGLYPDAVRKLVAIEGLGPPPEVVEFMQTTPFADQVREHFDKKRIASARIPRRYRTIEEAYARMKTENGYLTDEQARHLTVHGVNRNEDGTFTWKFDPHLNFWASYRNPPAERIHELWRAITAPTLLLNGADSWAENPVTSGAISHFGNATSIEFENAGHWLHHDQFDRFIRTAREFI